MQKTESPCIVLLPGIDGTGQLFEPLLPYLEGQFDYTVIRYIDTPQSLDEHARSVENKLSADQSFLLVAESFSSLVALRLLERKNLNISGVLFFAGFARAPCPSLIKLASFVPTSLVLKFSSNRLFTKLFFLTNGMPLNVLDLYLDVVRGIPSEVFKARLRILDQAKTLPSIKTHIPFGLLRVKQDLLVSKKAAEDLKALCDDLFIREAKGTHFFIQTKPEESAQMIKDFLEEITD